MSTPDRFNVLAVGSKAKDHTEMITAASPFFQQMTAENNFTTRVTLDADEINDENLTQYQVFVMLHLAPLI